MESDLAILCGTAAAIGFVHTLLGPDHYLPFIAMAGARGWSRRRALITTVICGVGHILGSVVIGGLGIWLGWSVGGMAGIESSRGEWAAWGLIAFGLVYGTWGLRRGLRNRPHTHRHVHADGTRHAHSHTHHDGHAHAHTASGKRSITPWVLFTVFVLGPCEPLIPLLMVPAMSHSWWGVALVAGVFGLVTIVTMAAVCWIALLGLNFLPVMRLERWSHALAGLAILLSGGAIRWLGL